MELFIHLSQKIFLASNTAAIFRFDIHQNDVRTDAADAVPGDNIVLPAAQKAEIPAGSRHDQGAKPPLRQFQPGISHKAQSPPVGNTDHFLAV